MTAPPIEVTTIVSVSPELAFNGFVGRFGAWWPLEGFTISSLKLKQPPQKLFIEPGVGGRIIEIDAEGVEHIWGSVKTWVEFSELEFEWHVGRQPDRATRVNVTFQPSDDGRTGITLRQFNWEIMGDEAMEMRERNAPVWKRIICDDFPAYLTKNATLLKTL